MNFDCYNHSDEDARRIKDAIDEYERGCDYIPLTKREKSLLKKKAFDPTKETRPVRGQINDEDLAYLKKVLEAPVELFVRLV